MGRFSAPGTGTHGAGPRLAPVVPLPVRHRRPRRDALLVRVLAHLRPAPPAGSPPAGVPAQARSTHPSAGAPDHPRAARLPDDAA